MDGSIVSLPSLPQKLQLKIFSQFIPHDRLHIHRIRHNAAILDSIDARRTYSTLTSLCTTNSSLLSMARKTLYTHPCFLGSDSQKLFMHTISANKGLRSLVRELDFWDGSNHWAENQRDEHVALLAFCQLSKIWLDDMCTLFAFRYFNSLLLPHLRSSLTSLTVRASSVGSKLSFNYITFRLHQFTALTHLSLWDFHAVQHVEWPTALHSLKSLELHRCNLCFEAVRGLMNSSRGMRILKISLDKRPPEEWINYTRNLKRDGKMWKMERFEVLLPVGCSFTPLNGVDRTKLGLWLELAKLMDAREGLTLGIQEQSESTSLAFEELRLLNRLIQFNNGFRTKKIRLVTTTSDNTIGKVYEPLMRIQTKVIDDCEEDWVLI
ncbi:hypothetical protein BT69DRAFT_1352902 [Atractiella rhizophila]|nr:hypothetical protein BT69DRAFT_1352902 [Atractiella rhizophila]